MAENIFRESFNIDDTDILKGLDDVEKALVKIQSEADSLATEFTTAFKDANEGAKGLAATLGQAAEQEAAIRSKQAADLNKVTAANTKWYDSLKQTIGGLVSFSNETKKATDDTQKATAALKENENQLARIERQRAEIAATIATQGGVIQKYQKQEIANLDRLEAKYKAEGAALKDATIKKESYSAATGKTSTAGKGLTSSISGVLGIVAKVSGALGIAAVFLNRFQSGLDLISRVTASASAVLNVMVERLVSFGSAIAKVFSGDFSGAANDISAAFTGMGAAIVDAATSAYKLEQRVQALRDVTITQSVEAARSRVELERYKKALDDGTLSVSARIKAQQAAAGIETKLANDAVARASQSLLNEQERFRLSTKTVEDKQKLADAEISLSETIIDANDVTAESEQKLRELRKEASEARLKQLEEERKALEKLAKDLENLRVQVTPEGIEKDLAATSKRFDDLQKITADGIAVLNKIESRRGLTDGESAQRDELLAIQVKLEERRQEALLDVVVEYSGKQIDIEEQQQKAKEALAKKDFEAAKAAVKAVSDLRDTETDIQEEQFKAFINLLTAQGSDEKLIAEKQFEFDQLVNQKRLETKLQFYESLLAITDAGDTTQIESLTKSIELVNAQIATLGTETAKTPKGKDSNSIWKLFGTDDEDGKERFNQNIDIILDGLNKLAEARIAEAAAAVAAAETKVNAAQQDLDEELKIKEDGDAANVALRTKELNAAKAARDQALREETKARRAQILLDGATQVSSLITTAANIFKGFSSIPLVGQILAIAAVASMFTAFAASKAIALKAVNAPKLRKGEKVIGRTHEQGGELRELEHNEQVIGAPESAGQDVFFENMRKGKYRGLDLAAMAERRGDYQNPLSDAAPRIHAIERRREAVSEMQHFKALEAAYERVGDKIVQAVNSRPVVKPWKQGYKETVKTQGGTVTKTVQPE